MDAGCDGWIERVWAVRSQEEEGGGVLDLTEEFYLLLASMYSGENKRLKGSVKDGTRQEHTRDDTIS